MDARRLSILQAARGHLRQQVLQLLVFPKNLHRGDPHRETSARLLLALVDEFEEPRYGTGHDAEALGGAIFADHGVCLTLR